MSNDKRVRLEGLSEIFAFFRENTTPIWFVAPVPFSLLGMDRWVKNLEFINYFDSFDRRHPRVFVPHLSGPRDFMSMEEVGNFLLGHKEVADCIRARGPGKVMLVMFDQESEQLVRELGCEMALPPDSLRRRIDSKIVTTQLGNEAGVASAPNVLGRAASHAELLALARGAGLGDDLVVQTPYGDSGRTTFFIRNAADWDAHAEQMRDEELKVMRHIRHMPGTLEACATRHGTLVGPLMTDITGYAELTPYKGGWCGNDAYPGVLTPERRDKVRAMARALGDRLWREGYKGVFCVDFLIDTDSGEVYLGELNPRISGATPPTSLITSTYGGVPLFLFHLLEFMDVDYVIDLEAVQARWTEFDTWSQLILKQTEDKVELITRAPASGIWKMQPDGGIRYDRFASDWTEVVGEDEAFYMRVYGAAEYRYKGADIGILVTRGRMQTDDRQLLERARQWAAGINAQFEGVPPAPEMPVVPPEPFEGKMF